MEIKERGSWASRVGFLLAIIGSTVGLGNVWRFPYLAYKNGGGVFLIPYFVALFTVGVPLMMLELAIGHKFKASAPLAFRRIGRRWEYLGWWMITFVFAGIQFYYCVVLAWCLNFLYYSFGLEWGKNTAGFFEKFLGVTKGPYYFGNINWTIIIALFVVWFVNWVIVYKGIRKGIEMVSKIIIPALAFIMIALVLWSVTLSGAEIGISAYLRPDFSKMLNPTIWADAFSQVFFSLSLGFGIVIAYASYLPPKVNIRSSAIITSLSSTAFAVLAGLIVFATLGYMSHVSGRPISDVVESGPGLAFVAYPAAMNLLPYGNQVFAVLFFLALLFAGITSSVSIFEATASSLIDKFGTSRKTITTVLAIVGFLGGIIFTTGAGIYWLDLVDFMLNHFGLVVAGLLEAIAVGWVYRTKRLRQHISKVMAPGMSAKSEVEPTEKGSFLGKLWEFAIIFWIPLVLGFLIIMEIVKHLFHPYGDYGWSFIGPVGFGWILVSLLIARFFYCRGWRCPPIKEAE